MSAPVVAAVVLAVIAGALVIALLSARRRRISLQAAHDESLMRLAADLEVAIADARESAERADELEDDRRRADERAEAADASRTEALAAVRAADQERAESEDRAHRAAAERDDALTDRDALAAEVTPLRERLLQLEASAERVLDEHRPGIEAEALWALELARSERTWRHSVAATPDEPSPFIDADDPLRVAVEIEVSALREDVGAAMELHWETSVDDPARCLVILRLAQELLSVASRDEQAVILRGHQEPDGAVVLHLTVPEGHAPLQLTPPPLGEHLISVSHADGLRLVVH